MVRALDHGGCERDAAKIAIGLDRSRFDPHIAVLYEGGFRTAEVRAAGIPIVSLDVSSYLNASAVRGARKMGAYIRQHGIQVVHAFDVPTDILGAIAARWYRVPVVITSQLSYRVLASPANRFALRFSDWLSDCIVVNSRAVGDSLSGQFGFPKQKLFLSYNGVNPADFHPGPPLRVPALEGASLVAGSVCVMRPEKRMDWVIRAFAAARKVNPGMHLLLVGGGAEVPKLIELRDQLGLAEVCHFEPGQADVAAWMRTLDIYINSSYSESFPNGLLEAMASGCCVVGSRVGGIPELITHMRDGLLFASDRLDELTDMLQLAASDAQVRNALRREAVATAQQRFSIRQAVERTESLYERLLERRGVRMPVLAG